MIRFTIDQKDVEGVENETIVQVAERYGIYIPTLCHNKGLEPVGMCRICTVELFDGRRTKFVTACNYPIWEGMQVKTDSQRILQGRKLITEMLLARSPHSKDLKALAEKYNAKPDRFKGEDTNCVLCGMCVRVCDRYGGKALTLAGRSKEIGIDTPFGKLSESCIGCGACASVCPTGKMRLEKAEGRLKVYHQDQLFADLPLRRCSLCDEEFVAEKLMDETLKRMGEAYVPVMLDVCPACSRKKMAQNIASTLCDYF